MSLDALRSALALERPDKSWGRTHKAVLECLGDHANAAGEAFVCVATICEEKWIDRKAVIKAMNDLREAGWIVDTGKRRGRTRQVIVWQMPWIDHRHKASRNRDTYADDHQAGQGGAAGGQQPQDVERDQANDEQARKGNGSESGTVSRRVPVSPGKGPGLTRKESPKRDTEPPTGYNPLPGNNPLPEGGSAQARTPAREDEKTETGKPKPAKKKTAKGKRLVPEDFEPRPEDLDWAKSRAPLIARPPGQIEIETERFLNYHRAEGNRFADVYRAWRNWMLKAQEFAARDSQKAKQAGGGQPRYLD